MRWRSLLFVPGDRPDRMDKALKMSADALILDLEDSVDAVAKSDARRAVAAFVARNAGSLPIIVRINPLEGGEWQADLAAVRDMPLAAIMLPNAGGASSVELLAAHLEQHGLAHAGIIPIATELPAAMFQLGGYREVGRYLRGMTWGAEDLSAALGAATARDDEGRYTAPYELARSLTLFAAVASGVQAIETIYPKIGDTAGLKAFALRARRDGFTGMMAIHPDQVEAINAAFAPSQVDIEHARAIVAAFEARPDSGALQLDGRMIDAPHLRQARRLLATAQASMTGAGS